MPDTPPPLSDQQEPPRLKFLRWLVIILTATMIVGLITIVTLIVMTFMRTGDGPDLGEARSLSIPEGENAQAYTKGRGWDAVVTRDADGKERIHIIDPQTGDIRQTVEIDPK